MKNTLTDLNNHLFAQLERLGDETLTHEQLQKEVYRGASIAQVSKEIISGGRLVLDAQIKTADLLVGQGVPKQLT